MLVQNQDDFVTAVDTELLAAMEQQVESKRQDRKQRGKAVAFDGPRRKEQALTIHVPAFE